jgi:hypothetical protein
LRSEPGKGERSKRAAPEGALREERQDRGALMFKERNEYGSTNENHA